MSQPFDGTHPLDPPVGHPLDRPVWSALATGWAQFSRGDDPYIYQLSPEYGPFAATMSWSDDTLARLAKLPLSEHGLWIVETGDFPTPPGMKLAARAPVVQMVAEDVEDLVGEFHVAPLTEADAPEMLALARLTKPGPFTTATHRLGPFIGVKQDGKLVAMAGERMQMPQFAELSGVCTHPDWQGRGYGAVLSSLVTRRMLDRGQTAFLHAYEGNTGAIRLYERLGYRHRRTMTLTALTR